MNCEQTLNLACVLISYILMLNANKSCIFNDDAMLIFNLPCNRPHYLSLIYLLSDKILSLICSRTPEWEAMHNALIGHKMNKRWGQLNAPAFCFLNVSWALGFPEFGEAPITLFTARQLHHKLFLHLNNLQFTQTNTKVVLWWEAKEPKATANIHLVLWQQTLAM